MSSPILLVVLFLAASACGVLEQEEANWPCQHVAVVDPLDINKVVGNWYYVQAIVNGELIEHSCIIYEITKVEEGSVLGINIKIRDTFGNDQNITYNYNEDTPARLRLGDFHMLVIDLPEDASTLVVSGCLKPNTNPGLSLTILTKTNTTDVGPVLARLRESGISISDNATLPENTSCLTV